MNSNISASWKKHLQEEFDKEYFKNLSDFVKSEYETGTCFPEENKIFEAFNLCDFEKVKVVIIGQDPYHGNGQANGLCFSVNEGVAPPPSMVNIFKELSSDLNIEYPASGDLSRWATQGVFLLNATLTVRKNQAGSHQKKGWETFTNAVISKLSAHRNDIVFLLWGGFAKKKAVLIDQQKHHLLQCGHPSPLSANRGYWFGNKHFSKTNNYLHSKGIKKIAW
jgi:uracil-DNA glycosylase